ncbi:hypothetical protein HK103_003007 [Boothiomyces macroporosus]|uniref:Uncharacterized protein n=1 Tax=Boothiomyces macroporosus TaxID=261099 RepID=A0AAD5Y4G3_9FUNG|nr:hypothetical protein HK103_003007 [Boothiomyces macroporosus]
MTASDHSGLKAIIVLGKKIVAELPTTNQFNTLKSFPLYGTNIQLLSKLFSEIDSLSLSTQVEVNKALGAPFDSLASRSRIMEQANESADAIVTFLTSGLKGAIPQIETIYQHLAVVDQVEE